MEAIFCTLLGLKSLKNSLFWLYPRLLSLIEFSRMLPWRVPCFVLMHRKWQTWKFTTILHGEISTWDYSWLQVIKDNYRWFHEYAIARIICEYTHDMLLLLLLLCLQGWRREGRSDIEYRGKGSLAAGAGAVLAGNRRGQTSAWAMLRTQSNLFKNRPIWFAQIRFLLYLSRLIVIFVVLQIVFKICKFVKKWISVPIFLSHLFKSPSSWGGGWGIVINRLWFFSTPGIIFIILCKSL